MSVTSVAILTGIVALFSLGVVVMIAHFYRKVPAGRALLIRSSRGERVTTRGALVVPFVHQAVEMDIAVKMMTVELAGRNSPHCKDSIRCDIKVTLFVRVNPTSEDLLQVAQSLGPERVSDVDALRDLLAPRCEQAIREVCGQLTFQELYAMREDFRHEIAVAIGTEIDGFVVDDLAIDFLEQTPIGYLDVDDIRDAEGIRAIAELMKDAELQANERDKQLAQQAARLEREQLEAQIAGERAQAEAEARHSFDLRAIEVQAVADSLACIAEQEARLPEAMRVSLHMTILESTVDERTTAELAAAAQAELARVRAERDDTVASLRVEQAETQASLQAEAIAEMERIAKQAAENPDAS